MAQKINIGKNINHNTSKPPIMYNIYGKDDAHYCEEMCHDTRDEQFFYVDRSLVGERNLCRKSNKIAWKNSHFSVDILYYPRHCLLPLNWLIPNKQLTCYPTTFNVLLAYRITVSIQPYWSHQC